MASLFMSPSLSRILAVPACAVLLLGSVGSLALLAVLVLVLGAVGGRLAVLSLLAAEALPAVLAAVRSSEKLTKFASGATEYLSIERCVNALDMGWCAAIVMDSLMLSYYRDGA